jgi:hypothetical protein
VNKVFSNNITDDIILDTNSRKLFLTEYIKNIQSHEPLLELENFIFKDKIFDLARISIQEMVGFVHESVYRQFGQMVLEHPSDINEKFDFFNQIIEHGGVWDGEYLFQNKKGNVYNNISNRIAKDLAIRISKELAGNIGIGPTQGIGEVFFALTGQGISMASIGDLMIYEKNIEIKTTTFNKRKYSSGRLYSNSGYGSNTQIKPILVKKLIEIGVNEKTVNHYMYNKSKTKPRGGFNLNNSGLKNLNNELSKLHNKEKTVDVFFTIIQNLYLFVDLEYVKSFLNNLVKDDGSFNPSIAMMVLIVIGHEYYASQKKHNGVMYFNVENGNYVLVENSSDYFNLLQNKTLALTSYIDWNDDRSKGTAQIVIK